MKSLQDDPKSVSREELAKLIEKGMAIPPHFSVESTLSKLHALTKEIDEWEEKTTAFLQSKSKRTIAEVEEFIKEANKVQAYLPSLDNLEDVLSKAKNWTNMVEEATKENNLPFYDTLDDMIRKGKIIPLQLDGLAQLETTLSQAKAWKEKTAKTFLRKNSRYTLMEVLSPRIGVGVQATKTKRNSKSDESAGAVYVCDTKLDESSDQADVVAAFRVAQQREMDAMRSLRERNLLKMKAEEDSKYCHCKQPRYGIMFQCELCKDWFHSKYSTYDCVPRDTGKGNVFVKSISCLSIVFCSNLCTPVQNVQQRQVASAERHEISLPELSALATTSPGNDTSPLAESPGNSDPVAGGHSTAVLNRTGDELAGKYGNSSTVLLDKTFSFIHARHNLVNKCLEFIQTLLTYLNQARVKTLFETQEVDTINKKLNMMSQKLVEAAAREKTEKIISSELKKVANNSELQQRVQNVASASGPQSDDSALSAAVSVKGHIDLLIVTSHIYRYLKQCEYFCSG